jgi:hypothetical protein
MNNRRASILAAVAVATAPAAVPASAAEPLATAAAKTFKNCTKLNEIYAHGVGRRGAHDKTSGTPVTNFKRSKALYQANKGSDRDGDGIACEKA